jgi:hypothetical protein
MGVESPDRPCLWLQTDSPEDQLPGRGSPGSSTLHSSQGKNSLHVTLMCSYLLFSLPVVNQQNAWNMAIQEAYLFCSEVVTSWSSHCRSASLKFLSVAS